MLSPLMLLITVVVLGVIFDFINGFHDTANAIATVVSTRVLSPQRAILMAAVLNFIGAVTGTEVARTIGAGLVDAHTITQETVIVALLAAICWNLFTWYGGIPSSSSHALVGGLIGAAIAQAGAGAPQYRAIFTTVIIPLLVSPIIGFLGAMLLMVILLRLVGSHSPAWVQGIFSHLQILSAALMAYAHGGNDAQKTMGIITLALVTYGAQQSFNVPLWVILLSATTMALGTASGGWRIIHTMGSRLAELRPIHGFAAETAAGLVIETASRLGFPLSTTQVIGASIMGVGASQRLRAVRWGVAGNIVTAWVVTIPTCAALGWGVYQAARLVVGMF